MHTQLCSITDSGTQLSPAAALKTPDELLQLLDTILHSSMWALHRAAKCLEMSGPLPFHFVRQARGCLLLLDVTAALLSDESACRKVLTQQELEEVTVDGKDCDERALLVFCPVMGRSTSLHSCGVYCSMKACSCLT
jgi:hypothetical protein